MKRIYLTLTLVLGWSALSWAVDCRPLDFYTRSVKMYINPTQGKQDLKSAEKLLTEALECYPKEGEVLYTAGLLFSQKKEYAKMTQVLNDAIKYSPAFKPKAETLKVVMLQETFRSANDYLDQAAKAEKALEKTKSFNEAIKLYHGCIIIDSTVTGPYRNLSFVFSSLGKGDSSRHYDDSSMHYDELLYRMAPDSAKWAYVYGVDLVNTGKYKEAIEVLERVVKSDSNHWDAWGLLGQLYEAGEHLPQMAAAYQRLSRQFPDSAEFLKQLAMYELRGGFNAGDSAVAKPHYHKADSLYSLYLSKNETDSTAWFSRGLALTSMKNYSEAAKVLDKTTAKYPGYADAWEALSGAYAQMGKAELAKKAYERSKQLSSEK